MARTKPSLRVKMKKSGLEVIKTFYDEFGKVIDKQIEFIKKYADWIKRTKNSKWSEQQATIVNS